MSQHVYTVIDEPTWKRAKCYEFGFLLKDSKRPPVIVLFFKDEQSAQSIFATLAELLGKDDPGNVLRISFAQGTHPQKGDGYAVGLGVNVENVPSANAGDEVVTNVYSSFKSAASTEQLEAFKEEYTAKQEYLIAPGWLNGGRQIISLPHGLRKRTLHFWAFDSIQPSDIEHKMFF